MTEIDLSYLPDSDWNKRLENSPLGTIYQTKEYALLIKSQLKSKPLYLTFFDNKGTILGQLLLFQTFRGRKKLAKFFGRGKLFSSLSKISKILPQEVFWTYGPVIFDTKNNNEIMKSLGVFIIKNRYYFYGNSHPLNNNCIFPQYFNFKTKTLGTFLINLKLGNENIFQNSDKHSVQKNIERAKERGVRVSEIKSSKDLVIYYKLLNEFRHANNLTLYSYEDVVEGFEFVKNIGQIGFLAWNNEIPIGGIFISSFNKYINEWGIARTFLDSEKKLYSLDLLRWEIIEWGIKNNMNYYDLSGVEIKNRSPKENGIFRNKRKWGGTLIEYSSFTNF